MRRWVVALVAPLLAGCNALFPLGEYRFEGDAATADGGSCGCAPPAGCWREGQCDTLRDVAFGEAFGCALFASGQVWCWGDNDHGQLAVGSRIDRSGRQLIDVPPATAIAAGRRHACAITMDGLVECWGANELGELGQGISGAFGLPEVSVGLSDVVQVAAGAAHTCARTGAGRIWCWGSNSVSQIGTGGGGSLSPVMLSSPGLTDPIDLDCGTNHTCALDGDGEVYCWGTNAFLAARGDTGVNPSGPTLVTTGATRLALGDHHSCVITDSAQVRCWGANHFGQVSGEGDEATFRIVPDTAGAISIAAGDRHTCAVLESGSKVSCWGDHALGQLGIGASGMDRTNVPLPVPLGVTSDTFLRAGAFTTCAVHPSSGAVHCWGSDLHGELTAERERFELMPQQVRLEGPATDVAVGEGFACAALERGVSCWGRNDLGQCGTGDRWTRSGPRAGAAIGIVRQLVAGDAHACADSEGSLSCWGDNSHGEAHPPSAGRGRPVTMPSIVLLPLAASLVDVALGDGHSCIVDSTGELVCWGENHREQLGWPMATAPQPPMPVPMRVEDQAVGVGDAHTCAIGSGRLQCWGASTSGQIGVLTPGTPFQDEPVTVIDMLASDVDGGFAHTCGVRAGEVLCWGSDAAGQLGDGTGSDDSAAPVNTGLAGIVEVALGAFHSCARNMMGQAWCWGLGRHGELGQGANADSDVPVMVELAAVRAIDAGRDATCAVDGKGLVWCWGSTDSGQLGTAGTWVVPDPTLLAGSPPP